MALFAGTLAPPPPDEQNFDLMEAKPGAQAPFGTDRFGRDVLSRVIYGARVSLYVALTSISLAMLVGGTLGLIAGYAGGAWDNAINRVMDVFFSIPGLLLAVGVAAMRGPGMNSAVVAITIVYTPIFVRVMRAPVLAEREKENIEAGRALGARRLVIALKHLLPNVLSPFVVQGTVAFSQAILIEASLSYLGLSAQPPTPSWGNMLNEGRTYLETAPWISVFSGIAIMVTVLAFNLLGAGLRDVLDPRPPELAESWETSKDGLTWTFKLRQGVKFHDGQEMTSADVKFTFDRLFEKSPGKSDFIAVDKGEPSGRYAVKFITKEPFAGLLAALGGFWGFIINEAGVKKHGDLNKAAVGTGPFVLEDWKVEQQMTLKKNPAYFKKGVPHVDQVILRVIPDEANIVAALRTGQIHHAFIEDNKNFNLLKDEKSLTGYRSSRLGYDYLNMSANRGPLKDVRVRQAISWAVDRSQVMRVATAGVGRAPAPATGALKQWQAADERRVEEYKPERH